MPADFEIKNGEIWSDWGRCWVIGCEKTDPHRHIICYKCGGIDMKGHCERCRKYQELDDISQSCRRILKEFAQAMRSWHPTVLFAVFFLLKSPKFWIALILISICGRGT